MAERGWSPEARRNAALARKIKNRLGMVAYLEFKRTGRVPAGLDRPAISSVTSSNPPVVATPEPPKPEVPTKGVMDSYVFQGWSTVRPPIKALRMAEKVHRIPEHFKRLDIKSSRPSTRKNGTYWYHINTDGTYEPKQITIQTDSRHILHTTLHEIAHSLDHTAFDPDLRTLYASETPPPEHADVFDTLIQEMLSSNRVQDLEHMLSLPGIPVPRRDGSVIYTAVPSKWIRYVTRPRELFADAYAQWIMLRSGDSREYDLLLSRNQGVGLLRKVWDDEDFGGIASAFDLLFEEMGWLKSS